MNRKKAWGRTLFAAVCCCAALTGSALAANEGAALVNANALNLRSAPNTGAQVLSVVYNKQPVIVEDIQNDYWFKVICNGTEGYMSGDYLDFYETLDANLGTGVIKGSSVRLRASASLNGQILGNYNSGTKLTILGVSGEWYKVSLSGTTGYVHSDYVTLDQQAAAASTAYTTGQKLVDTAMQYIGVPYVWAGTSPKGFDCSGLVFYCCKENGIDINRTAASIYSNGTYVERSQLQPGDAICFTNGSYSSIGHVGLYIGNGEFVHASSGSGCVTTNSLSENYYNNHYYGARRLVG